MKYYLIDYISITPNGNQSIGNSNVSDEGDLDIAAYKRLQADFLKLRSTSDLTIKNIIEVTKKQHDALCELVNNPYKPELKQ